MPNQKLQRRITNFIRQNSQKKMAPSLGTLTKDQRLHLHHTLNYVLNDNQSLLSFLGKLYQQFEALFNRVLEYSILKKYHLEFMHKVLESDEIALLIENLNTQLLANTNWLNNSNIKPAVDVSGIPTDFSHRFETIYEAHFAPLDKRIQSDDRPIRRMDSLARLFALKPSLSICASVAVHNGQLLISCNVAQQGLQQEIFEHIRDKAKLLAQIIQTTKADIDKYNEKIAYDNFQKNIEDYCTRLRDHGGSHIGSDRLEQALDKFITTICSDKETFSTEVLDVLHIKPENCLVTLPSIEHDGTLVLKQAPLTGGDELETGAMFLGTNVDAADLHKMHTEQLISAFIFRFEKQHQYSEENKIRIGVTKLCCATCHDELSSYPIEVRGCHNSTHELTYRLMQADIYGTKTPEANRPNVLNAKQSSLRTHHRHIRFLAEPTQLSPFSPGPESEPENRLHSPYKAPEESRYSSHEKMSLPFLSPEEHLQFHKSEADSKQSTEIDLQSQPKGFFQGVYAAMSAAFHQVINFFKQCFQHLFSASETLSEAVSKESEVDSHMPKPRPRPQGTAKRMQLKTLPELRDLGTSWQDNKTSIRDALRRQHLHGFFSIPEPDSSQPTKAPVVSRTLKF